MKIKDLREIERIDPFALGENRVNGYIDQAVKVTGLNRDFFEYFAKIALLGKKEEFLENFTYNTHFFNGGDDVKIIALRFVAIIRKQQTRVFKTPFILGEIDVKGMELKEMMDYGLFGGSHFWFLNAVQWDEQNILYYNDCSKEFFIKPIWEIL